MTLGLLVLLPNHRKPQSDGKIIVLVFVDYFEDAIKMGSLVVKPNSPKTNQSGAEMKSVAKVAIIIFPIVASVNFSSGPKNGSC